jgi:DNA-directed RNA polymerase subunit H (RpoH/RPB5)
MNVPASFTETTIEKLREALNNHETIRLHNTFRGIQISYEASFAMVSAGYVVLNVHPYQAACISLEKRTYLQTERMDTFVRGFPLAVNVKHKEVVLSRFTSTDANFRKRMLPRVQPRDPIRVKIGPRKGQMIVTLSDISMAGMGVFIFGTEIQKPVELKKGAVFNLSFSLPNSPHLLEMDGSIINFKPSKGALLYRLSIQIEPSAETETLLNQYIEQRQSEIMQELNLIYQDLLAHQPRI